MAAAAEERLRLEVDEYVKETFQDWTPNLQSATERGEGKVVRDAIHGYHHLDPWEVEVLDAPPVQRLRYIHQNALAYLVYPSATHSRFEHSLGVAKVVGDVAAALGNADGGGNLFDRNAVRELRLAALLHDVGHGIFSHLSESLIERHWHEQLAEIRQGEFFRGKRAGEILSYMIVTSGAFEGFLEDVIQRHKLNISPKKVAGYIVGHTDDPKLETYKADLITGPLDADKLDYIARDSYFTGIKSEIDVPHIVRSLAVRDGPHGERTLVVNLRGATAAEQMHFSRVALFPAMYHHQKVRALECVIRGMVDSIWSEPPAIQRSTLRFSKITDFLRLNDGDFLSAALEEPKLRIKALRLRNRMLPRRALHISASVIEGPVTATRYNDLVKLDMEKPDDYAVLTALRDEIWDGLRSRTRRRMNQRGVDKDDVWVDIPKKPGASGDLMRCYVYTGERDLRGLTSLFPIHDWLDSYSENKWAGHVFGYADEDFLTELNKVTLQALRRNYRLRLSPRASIEAKRTPPGP